MKDVLFYGILRPNRSPSQRFRIEQFFPLLKRNNIQFDYRFLLNERLDRALYSKGKYFEKLFIVLFCVGKLIFDALFIVHKYKYIFVERELIMLGTPFFEKLFARRSKLIYDFDDALWLLNMSEANKRFSFLKNPRKIEHIIASSKIVVAGNDFLKDYALQFNKDVRVIPTVVDANYYKRSHPYIEKLNKKVCIGWSGSHTTIEHFKTLTPVLKKILDKHKEKVYFKVIGDEYFVESQLNIKGIKWDPKTEVYELEEFDIGVMPLPNDQWSKGKCGLKGIIYMAMGIPNIMSTIGVNTSIVESGVNGYLCSSEDQWFETLDLLIEDFILRKEMGENGRKLVETKYSVYAVEKDFLNLFI